MRFHNAFHTGKEEWLYAPADSAARDELNEPIYMMSRQSDGSYQEILNYGKDKVFSRIRYYSPTGLTQREEFYQKHQDAPVSQIMNIVAEPFSGAINPYQFPEINKQENAHLYRVNQYEDGLISQAEFLNSENQRCFIEHWDRSVHSPEENYILYQYKIKDDKIVASATANGTLSMRARFCTRNVFPLPVGPTISILLFCSSTSPGVSPCSIRL